jgi:hypothetical protein
VKLARAAGAVSGEVGGLAGGGCFIGLFMR